LYRVTGAPLLRDPARQESRLLAAEVVLLYIGSEGRVPFRPARDSRPGEAIYGSPISDRWSRLSVSLDTETNTGNEYVPRLMFTEHQSDLEGGLFWTQPNP
jgi:hypothetical protein